MKPQNKRNPTTPIKIQFKPNSRSPSSSSMLNDATRHISILTEAGFLFLALPYNFSCF